MLNRFIYLFVRGSMDGKTLRLVAELVCGNVATGGPVPTVRDSESKAPETFSVPTPYLQKWQIKELFADCGFAGREELQQLYDESQTRKESRLNFAQTAIEFYCFTDVSEPVESTKFKNLILFLCAPRTYPGHPEIASKAARYLTDVLSFFNLEVHLEGARPKLVELIASGSTHQPFSFGDLPHGVGVIVAKEVCDDLRLRWQEACKCYDVGAFRAAMIMLGGTFEGVLKSVALQRPAEFKVAQQNRSRIDEPVNWELDSLIECAVKLGFVDKTRQASLGGVRLLRNLVHPFTNSGKLQINGADQHAVESAVAAIRGFVADAEKYLHEN